MSISAARAAGFALLSLVFSQNVAARHELGGVGDQSSASSFSCKKLD